MEYREQEYKEGMIAVVPIFSTGRGQSTTSNQQTKIPRLWKKWSKATNWKMKTPQQQLKKYKRWKRIK